ncbi:MAG: topoisomerase C-terminal repeat-containing protein [Caldilineaceae bacterium]
MLVAAANRKGGRGGTRNSKKNVLKELGEHPAGGPVQVLDGRYGPYVNYKKVNVTLPEGVTPESVTMAQALTWSHDQGRRQRWNNQSQPHQDKYGRGNERNDAKGHYYEEKHYCQAKRGQKGQYDQEKQRRQVEHHEEKYSQEGIGRI